MVFLAVDGRPLKRKSNKRRDAMNLLGIWESIIGFFTGIWESIIGFFTNLFGGGSSDNAA